MGFNESLTTNGNYTITNLRGATGIADDRISAHHPNAAGNETALGDFSIRALGHELSAGDLTRLLRPVQVTVNGSVQSISGSYGSGDPPFFDFDGITLDPRNPDKFTLRIDVPSGQKGQHAIQQVLRDGNGLIDAVSGNCQLIGRTANANSIDLQYEVTGFINLNAGVTFEDGMNVNAENYGTASTDKEGNNIPENAGLVFRTEDVLDDAPLITNVQVGIVDDGFTVFFDFNLDSNDQNLTEGFVVYDPASKIDGQFYMYDLDPASNPSYANDTEPDFEATVHPEQQVTQFSNAEGGRSVEFFIELRDQGGTTKDVVQVQIDEGDTGTWPSTEDQFAYETSEGRNAGTKSSPVTMNYIGQA